MVRDQIIEVKDIGSCLVGHGHDCASLMSGVNKDAQQLVSQSALLAIYFHYYAHKLNLILVDGCQSFSEAMDFFALLERLYVNPQVLLCIRNGKRNSGLKHRTRVISWGTMQSVNSSGSVTQDGPDV